MTRAKRPARWAVMAAAGVAGVLAPACEGAGVPLAMGEPGAPSIPAVQGYAAGEEMYFIHPEASDPAIADTLTAMMRSPVLVVPGLARVPDDALAKVYVFTNGVRPRGARGPLGYQPDVFDCPPVAACYSPLRAVQFATWVEPARAQTLTSAADVRVAVEREELRVEPAGVVVNMPFLTWPGGER